MAQGTFSRACAEFAKSAPAKEVAVFVSTVAQMQSSIKYGSALTGAGATPKAPAQFPRAGSLRESVTVTYPDAHTAIIYTTSPYAIDVEDNAKGHSFVDGEAHGWKKTHAAFDRIVETTAKRQAGAK